MFRRPAPMLLRASTARVPARRHSPGSTPHTAERAARARGQREGRPSREPSTPLRWRSQRAGRRELSTGADHRDPVHDATLFVVGGGVMHHGAVVPDEEITFLPAVAVAEL